MRNHCKASRPNPPNRPKAARTEKIGLKCPLCFETGTGAAVVEGDGAGVGMVVVVRCGAVVGGTEVVERLGAVVVVDSPGWVVVD